MKATLRNSDVTEAWSHRRQMTCGTRRVWNRTDTAGGRTHQSWTAWRPRSLGSGGQSTSALFSPHICTTPVELMARQHHSWLTEGLRGPWSASSLFPPLSVLTCTGSFVWHCSECVSVEAARLPPADGGTQATDDGLYKWLWSGCTGDELLLMVRRTPMMWTGTHVSASLMLMLTPH